MINDMASLKKAMEQMDADDPAVAEAAKDRAAKILSDANMNFSKLAQLIEQRRLLLRPSIVTNIKRMDQPEMLSDAAFRAAGASLRREGQSFRQIAEALELNSATAPQYEDAALRSEVPYRSEPVGPWLRTQTLAMRVVSFPLRHPIRFLTIALLTVLLFNALRDFSGFGRRISGYVGNVSAARESADAAVSSVSSFFDKWIRWRSREAASPSPASVPPPAAPSTGPAGTPATPPTAADASVGKPASPPSAPAAAPTPMPRRDAKGAPPSNPPLRYRRQGDQRPALDDVVPPEVRRNSRVAGPCNGGSGGCYWGGGRY